MRFILLCTTLLVSACGLGETTDVIYVCPSPSGEKIATFYRTSTGDRPGNQEMRVNVRPASSSFDAGMQSFAFRYGYDAIIRWNSDTKMRIEYPEDSILMHQELVIFGTSQTFSSSDVIKVEYQEKPSTHGYFMVEQRCFTKSR